MIYSKKIVFIFILPAIFVSLFSGCFFPRNSFSYNFPEWKNYSVGSAKLDGSGIEKIELDWVSGDINIHLQKGNDITFSESSDATISERHQLRYLYKDEVLKIRYIRPQRSIFRWFGMNNIPSKNLDIQIGEDLIKALENININVVSSDINMKNIPIKKLEVASVSGNIALSGKAPYDVEITTVSGKLITSSDIETIDYSTVSGDLLYEGENAPLDLDFSSVSANAVVRFSMCDGFKSSFESVSGRATYGFECKIKGDAAVYGDPVCDFDFETVSGDIIVEPIDE